ncbi:hypothetical protein BC832DRAFT_543198 [Gaertneriomyces semiglobifer]|nr:hypothetical protein BC832DRAFT_543198 [Gaertneriomyces semiglobifer]
MSPEPVMAELSKPKQGKGPAPAHHSPNKQSCPRSPPTPPTDKKNDLKINPTECQNQALTLNPKTVYVEDGSIRGYQPTLRNLTLKRRCDDGKDEDVQFWEELINDANPVAAVNRIPHSFVPRFEMVSLLLGDRRFGYSYRPSLRPGFPNIPILLKQDSPYERIIRRISPLEFDYARSQTPARRGQTFSLLIHSSPISPTSAITPTRPPYTVYSHHASPAHAPTSPHALPPHSFPNLHQHFATLGITSQMYARNEFEDLLEALKGERLLAPYADPHWRFGNGRVVPVHSDIKRQTAVAAGHACRALCVAFIDSRLEERERAVDGELADVTGEGTN